MLSPDLRSPVKRVGDGRKAHWEEVWTATAETGLSWFQDEPKQSLELIKAVAPERGGRIIDVGGGASLLVDRLLKLSFDKIAVLDISETALNKARVRLGDYSGRVEWVTADMTEIGNVGTFDIWHDRAVFHFLTNAEDREKYVTLARRTVPPGGHVIIATFASTGPKRCSNLPVCRYDADSLRAALGDGFVLVKEARESHTTPRGSSQPFFYGVFTRENG
jgi:ubiquinone/menaquinone biosynthesis C-methylase UbiE